MAADRIWAAVGDLDAFYYGAAADGFIPAVELTLERAQALLPLGLYALLVLVREFLPAMLVRGDGAILSAQGASALQGRPNIAGGFALAVQRNYLQSLHAAVADKGVYVGGLYIGAAIEHSRFHTEREAAKAAGATIPEMPTVDPHHLADLLWTLHGTRSRPEATYPERLFDPRVCSPRGGWYLASSASSLATLGEERPGSNSASSQWSRTFSAASGAMTRAPMVRTWALLDLRARSAE
jgi:hypothetical protein